MDDQQKDFLNTDFINESKWLYRIAERPFVVGMLRVGF